MSNCFKTERMFFMAFPAAAVGIALFQAALAQAAPIGNPSAANFWDTTSAVSISDYSGERDTSGSPDGNGNRKVINTINGTGISGTNGDLHNFGAPHGQMGMFASLPDGAGDSGTFGMPGVFGSPNPGTLQGSASHWIEYQFDQAYTLTDIAIWNYNETTYYTQGWRHVAVQVSATGGSSASDWTTVFNGELPLSVGVGAAPTQPSLVIPVSSLSAQYVTVINTGIGNEANWRGSEGGAGVDDGSHAGLSEIRFNSGLLAPVAGDINGDFQVNLTDYGILTGNWLQTVPASTLGDFTGDGLVNIRDFGLFKGFYNDFNNIPGGGAGLAPPVPEPSTLLLLALALPAVFVWRLRARRTD